MDYTAPTARRAVVSDQSARSVSSPWLTAWCLADEAAEDPEIINIQYIGQIVVESFQLYGLKTPDSVETTLQSLYALNTTLTPGSAAYEQQTEEALTDVARIISEPFTLALSGTLWLYPTAVRPATCE